jgi:hypothetical protein
MGRSSFFLAIPVLLIAIAGCGKGSSESVTSAPRAISALPSGWKSIATSGIELAFPPDWKVVDLAKDVFEKSSSAAFGNDPKAQSMLEQVKALAAQGSFKLFVFDSKTMGTGFATNCNVNVTQVTAGTTLETAGEQSKTQLQPLVAPGSEIKVEYVDLPAGKAARIKSQLKTALPAAPLLDSVAYGFINGTDMTVVTFTSAPSQTAEVSKIAEQTMGTFKFTK